MELEAVRRFVNVVDLGGVRAAAEGLHVSPSAISRSINQLENDLGTPLLDVRREHTTEAGEIALPIARQLLKDADQLQFSVSQFIDQEKIIRIAACSPSPIWLLTDLTQKSLSGTILTSDVLPSSEAAAQRLAARETDIAITIAPIKLPFIETVPLMHEQLLASVPKGTELARQESCCFSDFAGKTIVVFKNIGFWFDLFKKEMPTAHFVVQEDMLVFLSTNQSTDSIHFEVSSPDPDASNARAAIAAQATGDRRVLVPVADESAQVTYYANWYRDMRAPIKRQMEALGKLIQKYTDGQRSKAAALRQ